jgi:hypothetical protein
MPPAKRPVVRLEVRLDPAVHAAATASAEADRRTLNAQIEVLVSEALAARERATKKPRSIRAADA